MFIEDNTGFINFPVQNSAEIATIDSGKTLVYIVCFDVFRKNKISKIKFKNAKQNQK